MRLGLFVPALIANVSFALAQEPAEPPAASRRPNLKVLTTVPESQLFLMMNAISDSLGVRCDYCHVRVSPDPSKTWSLAGGWVWDRDDKPAKLAGREMMRMVLDINKQFGGRMVVTCNTCHRGALAPARTPPLPPRDYSTISANPAPTLPAMDDVWKAYVRAVGEPAGGFMTTVLTATDTRSEGRHGTLEIVLKGPDRIRFTGGVPPDVPFSQIVKGENGWIASSGRSRVLRPDEIARVRRSVLRYRAIKIDPPANWRIAGIERVRNRDAYVAESRIDARTRRVWFFEIATGLLLREQTTIETALVPLQQQIDYDDYRRVDGVMLPFRVRYSDDGPFDTSDCVFTSIKHNVDVDDSTFEVPAQPQTPQTPPSAGARYKSVRVLTGMPATGMIPTMAFISNSLGVTCLHCHTDVYESDEKPMKQKAREMIEMTHAMNEAQFGGKRVLTCQTCHNGRAIPESIPAIENAGWNKPPAAAESALPSAAAVLRRYAEAVGVDALERLRNQRLTGTVTRRSGRTAPASDTFELVQERPRSMRLSTKLSHPPEADAELPITFLRASQLAAVYPDLQIVGRTTLGGTTINGDPVLIATGTSARGVHRLYFSESSGLLVRRSDEIETPLGLVPEFYDFTEFKRVDGAMVPTKIVWSRADYQVTFIVTEIRHNVTGTP